MQKELRTFRNAVDILSIDIDRIGYKPEPSAIKLLADVELALTNLKAVLQPKGKKP